MTPSRTGSVFVHFDETGQQTGGRYLIVAAVAVTSHRRLIDARLCEAERLSKKGGQDWSGTSPTRLSRYLSMALEIPDLQGGIFYRVCKNVDPKQYVNMTISAALDPEQALHEAL